MSGFRGVFGVCRLIKLFIKLSVAYLNPFGVYWLNSIVFDLWRMAILEYKVDMVLKELDEDEKKINEIKSAMVCYFFGKGICY